MAIIWCGRSVFVKDAALAIGNFLHRVIVRCQGRCDAPVAVCKGHKIHAVDEISRRYGVVSQVVALGIFLRRLYGVVTSLALIKAEAIEVFQYGIETVAFQNLSANGKARVGGAVCQDIVAIKRIRIGPNFSVDAHGRVVIGGGQGITFAEGGEVGGERHDGGARLPLARQVIVA